MSWDTQVIGMNTWRCWEISLKGYGKQISPWNLANVTGIAEVDFLEQTLEKDTTPQIETVGRILDTDRPKTKKTCMLGIINFYKRYISKLCRNNRTTYWTHQRSRSRSQFINSINLLAYILLSFWLHVLVTCMRRAHQVSMAALYIPRLCIYILLDTVLATDVNKYSLASARCQPIWRTKFGELDLFLAVAKDCAIVSQGDKPTF